MAAMTDITLKVCAVLFQYPDQALLSGLPEIWAVVDDLPAGQLKNGLGEILQDMAARPPLALQEIYTAAFDLTPATTLNLTYHSFGDNEKRAAALVHLQQLYAAAGYPNISTELPDFLPLMLEFLSVCADEQIRERVWAYMGDLNGLAARLEKSAPSYAALLKLLAGLRPPASAGAANKDDDGTA